MAPGSLYISANTASGRRIEATADGDGYFTTTDMDGRVNYQTGVVTVRFGRFVTAAGNEASPGMTPRQVGRTARSGAPPAWWPTPSVQLRGVQLSAARCRHHRAGSGAAAVRWPGAVHPHRTTVVVHSTRKSAFPMGVSAGQQLNTGRERLAHAHVEDKDGKRWPRRSTASTWTAAW